VRFTDAAGNASDPGVSPTYELDRVRPEAPRVTGTFGVGNDPAARWDVAGEDGTVVRCTLERNGLVDRTLDPCPRTVSATLDQDGDWVLLATLTDRAGNTSFTGSSVVYTLDTAAPATPAVQGPEGTDNVRRVTWSWTADTTPTTAECRLLHNAQVYPGWDWAGCRSPADGLAGRGRPLAVAGPAARPGRHLSDPVGQSPVYDLDTEAPVAPVVTAPRSPAPTAPRSSRSRASRVRTWSARSCTGAPSCGPGPPARRRSRSTSRGRAGRLRGAGPAHRRRREHQPDRPVAGLPARHAGAGCPDRGGDQRRRVAGPADVDVHRRVPARAPSAR
jgi:hypothetical protein